MSDADAFEAEFDNLGEKIKSATLDLAGGAITLTAEQAMDLVELTDDVALALAGDERARAHLDAQFALQRFSASARAYLELVEFRRALAQAILDTVGAMVSVGAKLAGEALAGALVAAID